jgi:hypothetical protein
VKNISFATHKYVRINENYYYVFVKIDLLITVAAWPEVYTVLEGTNTGIVASYPL